MIATDDRLTPTGLLAACRLRYDGFDRYERAGRRPRWPARPAPSSRSARTPPVTRKPSSPPLHEHDTPFTRPQRPSGQH